MCVVAVVVVSVVRVVRCFGDVLVCVYNTGVVLLFLSLLFVIVYRRINVAYINIAVIDVTVGV